MAHRALLFDLDGTILSSRAWYASVAACGEDAAPFLSDLAAGRSVAGLLRRRPGQASFRTACSADPVPLYDGIAEVLAALNERGELCGVVTNLPKWMTQPLLSGAGLAAALRTVVDWGVTTRHKPDAAPITAALQELTVSPSNESWYIGDTDQDRQAARNAGVSFAWASWGYGELTADPDATLTVPGDILCL